MTTLQRSTTPSLSTVEASETATFDSTARAGVATGTAPVAHARAWFALSQHSFRRVALVPADASVSSLPIARAIVAASQTYSVKLARLLAGEGVSAGSIHVLLEELARCDAFPGQTIVTTGSPLVEPGAISIARAADACVLIVQLGRTTLRDARETMTSIGEDRFIGSLAVTAP